MKSHGAMRKYGLINVIPPARFCSPYNTIRCGFARQAFECGAGKGFVMEIRQVQGDTVTIPCTGPRAERSFFSLSGEWGHLRLELGVEKPWRKILANPSISPARHG
jgi:hypothetical protein